MNEKEKKYYTINEVAKMLNRTSQTIYGYLRASDLNEASKKRGNRDVKVVVNDFKLKHLANNQV